MAGRVDDDAEALRAGQMLPAVRPRVRRVRPAARPAEYARPVWAGGRSFEWRPYVANTGVNEGVKSAAGGVAVRRSVSDEV